jgi:hypothetical protein
LTVFRAFWKEIFRHRGQRKSKKVKPLINSDCRGLGEKLKGGSVARESLLVASGAAVENLDSCLRRNDSMPQE